MTLPRSLRVVLVAFALLFALAARTAAQDAGKTGAWTDAELAEIRGILAELAGARAQIQKAEARLVDLVLSHGSTKPPVDPPDPPEPPDPPVDPPAGGGEPWPEDLPFDAPEIPAYHFPTLEDCEWTVAGGVFSSMLGLPDAANVREAYRASIAAGHEKPITFGVYDNAGKAVVGGQWNPDAPHSITRKLEDGTWSEDIQVEFLGLDDSCEVRLGWGRSWGYGSHVGAFNIGLRGGNDSFIIRANDGVGTLIIDGCYWLPHVREDGTPQNHASALHVDKWKTFVWRRHKYRGLEPSDPGTLVREHSVYFKSCVGDPAEGGGTWIVSNDLRGGNRTGFQLRPQPTGTYGNPRPRGPIVIAYNFADGYGWDHGSDGASYSGGGCLTSWIGPESPVYVFGNTITDAKYACLVLSGQAPDRNWLNADGFPIAEAHVYGNTFENRRGDRAAVSLSAVGDLHLYENRIAGAQNGDLTLDSPWNMGVNGIENGSVQIHGRAVLDELLGLNVKTYDPAQPGKAKAMPPAQLESYLFDEPIVVEEPVR